jgi:hypothetical protein
MLTPAKKIKAKDYSDWNLGGDLKGELAVRDRFVKFLDAELARARDDAIAAEQQLLADLANKGCESWLAVTPKDIRIEIAPSVAPHEYESIWTLSLREAFAGHFDPNDPDDARDRKRTAGILRAIADEIEAGK